jgi:hypothetical protein
MHELMSQDAGLAAHFSSLILKRLHVLANDLLAVESLLSASEAAATTLNSQLAFEQGGNARAVS